MLSSDEPYQKRMGWLCSYTPLELFYAAEYSPKRVIGHAQPVNTADAYMSTNICQFIRSSVDVLMDGGYNDIDGVVFVNSCDAMRRFYDIWRNYCPSKFHFMLDLPAGQSDYDVAYFRDQLANLQQALEKLIGESISEEMIDLAIQGLQGARTRYHQLLRLRKKKPLGLSASELYILTHTFFVSDLSSWMSGVDAILAKPHPPKNTSNPRVVLAGSPIHNPEFLLFFENLGFDVVYEDLCSGSRFFEVEVPPGADPLLRLSQAYLTKPSCARMMMIDDRKKNISDKVREYAADGVIHYSLKFCDTYSYDVPEMKRYLADEGIPSLFLEGDCTLGSMGQLKTRIEAFREIIKGGN